MYIFDALQIYKNISGSSNKIQGGLKVLIRREINEGILKLFPRPISTLDDFRIRLTNV